MKFQLENVWSLSRVVIYWPIGKISNGMTKNHETDAWENKHIYIGLRELLYVCSSTLFVYKHTYAKTGSLPKFSTNLNSCAIENYEPSWTLHCILPSLNYSWLETVKNETWKNVSETKRPFSKHVIEVGAELEMHHLNKFVFKAKNRLWTLLWQMGLFYTCSRKQRLMCHNKVQSLFLA